MQRSLLLVLCIAASAGVGIAAYERLEHLPCLGGDACAEQYRLADVILALQPDLGTVALPKELAHLLHFGQVNRDVDGLIVSYELWHTHPGDLAAACHALTGVPEQVYRAMLDGTFACVAWVTQGTVDGTAYITHGIGTCYHGVADPFLAQWRWWSARAASWWRGPPPPLITADALQYPRFECAPSARIYTKRAATLAAGECAAGDACGLKDGITFYSNDYWPFLACVYDGTDALPADKGRLELFCTDMTCQVYSLEFVAAARERPASQTLHLILAGYGPGDAGPRGPSGPPGAQGMTDANRAALEKAGMWS